MAEQCYIWTKMYSACAFNFNNFYTFIRRKLRYVLWYRKFP